MQKMLHHQSVNMQSSSGVRVLAMGVFDLFHVGHLRYLQQARSMGEHLTVGVATDAISMASKGKLPIVPEKERLEIVSALACVDTAYLLPSTTMEAERALGWIRDWKITLVRIGAAWEGSERWGRLVPLLAEHGIAVSFAPETPGTSTTRLIQTARNLG
jgi:cytidyltransferase-like protein